MKPLMAFIRALGRLCEQLNIPTLREYGIDKDNSTALIDKMAVDAMASGSPSNTIKEVTKNDLDAYIKSSGEPQ